MIQISHVMIREVDVQNVRWRRGRLTLTVRWPLESLPVLLDLPEDVLLTWHGSDDPEAGLTGEVDGWTWTHSGRVDIALRIP